MEFSLGVRLLFVLFQVSDTWNSCLRKKGEAWKDFHPAKDALKLHVKDTTYQGVYVWGQATIAKPVLPDPRIGAGLSTAVSCKELVYCGCNKNWQKMQMHKSRSSVHPSLYE